MESLIDSEDYSETLTRAKFEELNLDLFKKTLIPVQKVRQTRARAHGPQPSSLGHAVTTTVVTTAAPLNGFQLNSPAVFSLFFFSKCFTGPFSV